MVTAARNIQDNSARTATYRVVTTLGAGGTALVYLAVAERSAGFQKLVVLKTLLSHLANEPNVSEMFRNEARIAARLKHPNVVEVYEVFDDLDQPVLVMEYLRGSSLRDLVKTTAGDPIPLRHLIEVLKQSCRGLHHCHELRDFDGTPMRFIHRDVSPHNIYVTFEGEVRLLDFGIAKVQGHDGGTQTGLLKGKIRYMAPEQMMGEELDRRADIYAIGVCLWEAISGKDMWGNLTEGMILHKTVNGDLPALEATEECPAEILEITRKCLAVRREDRYETAEEIADDLERVLRTMPDPRRRLGQVVRTLFSARDEEVAALVRTALANSEGVPTFEGGIIDWGDVLSDTRTSTLVDARHLMSRATRRQTSTRAEQAAEALAASEARRGRVRWSVAAGAALLALGGGLFALRPTTPDATSLVAVPSATLVLHPDVNVPTQRTLSMLRAQEASEVVTGAVQAPHEVKIRVETNPRAASLYLDDELIGNPSILGRASDGSTHRLKASARGYDDIEREVVFNHDQDIELKLVRSRTGSKRSSHSTSPNPTPTPSTVEPAPAEPVPQVTATKEEDCKSEFVLRDDGLLGVKKSTSKACRLLKGK